MGPLFGSGQTTHRPGVKNQRNVSEAMEGVGYRLGDQQARRWMWAGQPPSGAIAGLLDPAPQLTKWHDGDIFSPELAGDGDFLPEAPAVLREHVVGSRRGMVAYLGSDQLHVSTVRHRPAREGQPALCPGCMAPSHVSPQWEAQCPEWKSSLSGLPSPWGE